METPNHAPRQTHDAPEADNAAITPTYPVRLTKTEARLLIGMAMNPEYEKFEDYTETITPLIEKLRAVL